MRRTLVVTLLAAPLLAVAPAVQAAVAVPVGFVGCHEITGAGHFFGVVDPQGSGSAGSPVLPGDCPGNSRDPR